MFLPDNIRAFVKDEPFRTDSVGMSRGSVFIYSDTVLKTEEYNDNVISSVKMMKWLDGKIPVPKVICHEVHDGMSYLLMSRIKGKMSCSEYFLERPKELVSLLAEGLYMLWDTDISDCPVSKSLENELSECRYNIENDLVDIENTEPDTFGKNGRFKDPWELLEWLENNKPPCDKVLSHGDFCLPNIFLSDGKVSGFIDLGGAGTADRWRDISLCYRSLRHNLDGTFGRKVYENTDPKMLFDALGIACDEERLNYWILLDELF